MKKLIILGSIIVFGWTLGIDMGNMGMGIGNNGITTTQTNGNGKTTSTTYGPGGTTSSTTYVINDDDNANDGDGCDKSDYHTIKAALDDIRDNGDDSNLYIIKVCTNEGNDTAYSDVLDINSSKMKGLVIERDNPAKSYLILENNTTTPIIVNGIDDVNISGAVIKTDGNGIDLNQSVDGFILDDTNITVSGCGVNKIHNVGKFMDHFQMNGGYIDSNSSSALCLQDINSTGCSNKFIGIKIKAKKFGFDITNNVRGCMVIEDGDISGDGGGMCTDMNVSITHSVGHKNNFFSKNMGLRLGGGAFDFRGMDLKVDTADASSSDRNIQCKGSTKGSGYGIYVDKIDADYNFTIDELNMSSDDNGVFVEGNDSSKFTISNSEFYSKNTALEINHSTSDWNITNVDFNSSDGYAFKITGGIKPTLEDVSAVSKYGVLFTDVLNMQIIGKSSLKKVVATNGDAIYFAGSDGNFSIKNMMLTAPNGSGIVFEGTGKEFNLTNSYFLNCGDYGVYFKGTQNKADTKAQFNGNLFMNNGSSGVKIENSDNSFDLNISNNTFFESSAINNDEEGVVVDENYWGSFPFGNGKSDKDETPTSDGNAPKTDNSYLTYSPVKFEDIDYQFDECDNNKQPTDAQKPDAGVTASKHNADYTYGKIVSGMDFNTTGYVDVDNIALSDEVTFMAWIRLNQNNDGTIISDQDNNITISNQKVSFNMNLDGKVYNVKSDTLNLNKWYQVVACYDGKNMKIYLNGDENASIQASGFVTNYDTNLTIGKDLNATIDEAKILKISVCATSDNVKKIYEYENNSREYYTQRDRSDVSGVCQYSPHLFDAKDKGRTDNNISTKKIGNDINLSIDSNTNFSGYVYCVVQDGDKNISDINKSNWNDQKENNITLVNITQISRDAHIYIKWDDNTSNNDDGETNSTDHFAIIPIKYVFNVPSEIKAGETYSIEINATNQNDINQSYTQTLDGTSDKNSTLVFIHKDGSKEDNITLKLDFSDGVSDRNDFNISDIGKYVLELNDTNYAQIDKDDTAEINRTIYGTKTINVVPYKFKIEIKTNKTSTGSKWLYQGSEFNYTLEANITALSKNNDILTHFDKNEYSTDVNATLNFILKKMIESDEVNLTYIKSENNQNSSNQLVIDNKKYDVNFTIKDSNFTKGQSTLFGIVGYIKKDTTTPSSPIDMNITDINTTSKTAQNEGVHIDNNISYFYPRLNTQDIFTTYKETNSTIFLLVYDKNGTDASKRFGKENMNLINWYKNNADQTDNILQMQMRTSSDMSSDFIDINLTKFTPNNAEQNISVDNNTTPKTTYGLIHLDTPTYLWYSKFGESYSYSSNSSCVNHYCIEYNYKGESGDTYDVGSGVYQGSEVNNTMKTSTDRKGVKIFR